jgi:hypothetical protein
LNAGFGYNIAEHVGSGWAHINADSCGYQSPESTLATEGSDTGASVVIGEKVNVFTVRNTASVGLVNVALRVQGTIRNTSESDWVGIEVRRTHFDAVACGPICILIQSGASRFAFPGVVVLYGEFIRWAGCDALP